jgi:FKBP-type peptidyl-prolyl cis-trans isomerase
LAEVGGLVETNFQLFAKSNGKDTLLMSSIGMPPGQSTMLVKNPDSVSYVGSFEEYLKNMHLKDSVTLWFSVDSLFSKIMRREMLPGIDKGTKARLELSITKIIPKAQLDKMRAEQQKMMEEQQKAQEEQMRKMQEENEKQKPIDDKKLKDFLAKNKINAKKSESGLYYVIKTEGTGAAVGRGDMVSLFYKGSLLDGTEFDSNVGKDPFTFPALSMQVVPGFDEGVALLKQGGKADIYIPSYLGYGGQGQGKIPPYSILKFEIEVTKIEKAKQ